MKNIRKQVPALFLLVGVVALFTVTVQAKTKADYKLYSDFLKQDEYVYKLAKKNDSGLSTYGLTFYDTYGSARYERKSISFCLLDLNNDGVKELIVAREGFNWDPQAMTLYVFTIRKGKVVFVKNKGTEDYTIRTNGKKVKYSKKYNALYCPALVQNSDAYCDDEKETWSLYRMKGTKMVRYRYADSHLQQSLTGDGETVRTYHYQNGSSTKKMKTLKGEQTAEYTEYCSTYFQDLDLKSCKMYRNNAKNRKKYLGKA